MTHEIFDLDVADARLSVHRWLPDRQPSWVVIIVHGMGEHGGRYRRFAEALSAAGAAVYAPDLPGHGLSAIDAAPLGHFADRDGWALALSAIGRVRDNAGLAHRGAPLFLFGHSMGSFLSQQYLVEHGQGLTGAVLSSTSATMGPLRAIGALLMRLESLLYGPRHRSLLAYALSFRKFNQRFAPVRTHSDWLSGDVGEVDKHLADPLAAYLSTARLWFDLLTAGKSLRDPKRLARIPKNLPILMIAGSKDAVSEGGRGSQQLADDYRAAGLHDVTVRIYPDGRHELLNDLCRDEVTADLLGWFASHRLAQAATSNSTTPAAIDDGDRAPPAAEFA